MSHMFDLHDRVAIVTGGGQGVGASISRMLAAQGAFVIVNDLYEDRAAETVAAICDAGGSAIPIAADVTDVDAVADLVSRSESSSGPVDILVNNAGLYPSGNGFKPFADSDPREWRPYVDVNLYGVLTVTRAVLPGMIARGHGRIVTIVSDAGRIGEPFQAVYAAAKAGAAGFSRSLAKEVGKHGVTCNSIALGSITNPNVSKDPERLAKQRRVYPMRRLGEPADVGTTVVWVVSDEASWVTGQTIPLNGGYSTS